jgi:hypothetical protein
MDINDIEYSIEELRVTFPTLYKVGADGRTRVWYAYITLTSKDDGSDVNVKESKLLEKNWYTKGGFGKYISTINSFSGIVDKKHVHHQHQIFKGHKLKTVARTNVLTRAIDKVQRDISLKIKSGYFLEQESAEEEYASGSKFYPMKVGNIPESASSIRDLAYMFEDNDPVHIEEKLDGVRTITTARVDRSDDSVSFKLMSRQGTQFVQPVKVIDELKALYRCAHHTIVPLYDKDTKKATIYEDIVFDGELFIPGKTAEDIAGALMARKFTNTHLSLFEQMKLCLFDFVLISTLVDRPGYNFGIRRGILERMMSNYAKRRVKSSITLIKSPVCADVEEAQDLWKTYFKPRGAEGIILKKESCMYIMKHRTNCFVKFKEFKLEEFPIVGYEEGKGAHRGTIIWKLQTRQGHVFKATQNATLEEQRNLLKIAKKNFSQFEGQLMRVKFFEYTKKNHVPKHAKALGIRYGDV